MAELYEGRDGVVRGAKLKTRKTPIDRALQQSCPLELHSERRQEKSEKHSTLDPEEAAFKLRLKATTVARHGVEAVLNYEDT